MNSQLHWGLTWKHLSGIKGSFAAHTLYNSTHVLVHLGTDVVQDAHRWEGENLGFGNLWCCKKKSSLDKVSIPEQVATKH